MNKYKEASDNLIDPKSAVSAITQIPFCHPATNDDLKVVSKVIQLSDAVELFINNEDDLLKIKPKKSSKASPNKYPGNTEAAIPPNNSTPFRLFVKNGEYVYARPQDILMIESCDHMVKVYLLVNDKIKKTIRHNTLKDFLLQLPPHQFLRIGRFCAVNMQRISGGNCNEQSFEFDLKISIKLKHSISAASFSSIGK